MMLLAESDFTWSDVESALQELLRISEGEPPLSEAAVEVPETRREIIDDCRQSIAWRLQFDFSQWHAG